MIIIAEAGIAHNGDIQIAKELVDKAKWTGADIVKFQTFWGINRMKKYELTKNEWGELRDYCVDKDITFLSTPHTFEAIHFLDYQTPMYKVASPYLCVPNFLMEIASKNKPILLSTGSLVHKNGMATDEEIRYALSFIPDADVTLLHCVSQYPCPDRHISRIVDLGQKFDRPVGISDHTKEIKMPRLPVIEKHIMLDGVKSIDESVSLTPDKFKEMVDYLRRSE